MCVLSKPGVKTGNLSFEGSSSRTSGGITALQGLPTRDASSQAKSSGDGVFGGVGTFAVQIANPSRGAHCRVQHEECRHGAIDWR